MRHRLLLQLGLFAIASGLPSEAALAGQDTLPEGRTVATRAEELRQRRAAKKQQLTPPVENFFEGYFKDFDRRGHQSLGQSSFWGFHPRLDWISRGSGIAAGVRYWHPEVAGPVDLMGSAFYSARRYQHYDLHLGQIPNRGRRMPSQSMEKDEADQLGDIDQTRFSRFKLYATARFRDRTRERFFGLGPGSQKEDETAFRIRDTLLDAVTGYQFSEQVGYTFKAGLLHHSLDRGRGQEAAVEGFPGTGNPPNYFRIQNSLLLDFRDAPDDPRRGFVAAMTIENFRHTNGDDRFNFHRAGIDSRVFLPLWSSQRVLALRAVVVQADPAAGNGVPIFLMPTLGGSDSLRGYRTHRLRGEKALLLQAEYRWYPSRRIELALFGDTGTVARVGQRLDLDRLRSDWGVGLRVRPTRGWILRLDQAFSNEGYRLLLRFSTAF